MIRRISHLHTANPNADDLRRGTRASTVSAVFHDPDAAGRAYDVAVELGYANEEITAAASGAIPPELVRTPANGDRRLGAVLLAVEPRCKEDGQWIVERWRAYGGREVAGIR